MKEITCDAASIAFCGLYCGACKKFLSDKCPGCQGNDKASWCKIRTCCMEHDYRSCADCEEFADVSECKKFDNFMARIFGLLFNSNRVECVRVIKDQGYDAFARQMTESKRQSMPR